MLTEVQWRVYHPGVRTETILLAECSQRFSVRQVRRGGRCCLMASSVYPRARLALHRLWAWIDTGGLTAQRLPLSLTLTELGFSVANAHTVEVQRR